MAILEITCRVECDRCGDETELEIDGGTVTEPAVERGLQGHGWSVNRQHWTFKHLCPTCTDEVNAEDEAESADEDEENEGEGGDS
jgi:hypothetical protein